ncbi:MAG: preprotein translocase subunit SecA [Bacilli bacterium]|nr:preprotein translocase subunit SecA [bacterium]MDY2696848.1 preprotein translocase subunit SecA [Bacilli bacterium]MDY5992844.1 preprotein translocase subunit SecA [Bacilli bacterium]MEE0014393.1 preprotein translocase subunit SecA [Bacilli bacterium]
MNLLRKLFDHEYKEMKKFTTLADKVMALDEEYSKLTDTELQNKTEEFRNRLRDGETLDDILVEAFATAREAAFRVLGEKHFYVQILGGLAIHYGNIAEMKTGEGKTLTSVLPAYLNALSGEGVHIITVNEYLATRDADWMGKIHEFLGLTVGVNTRDLSPKEKQEAYNCDILYSTNNEIGFDYLRDNMVVHKEDRVQRKLNFAIIDEVDSVLIDEARTPLIISGGEMKSANLYIDADRFAKSLKDEKDYIYDEKTKSVNLTDAGSEKAEKTFNIKNLYEIENAELLHYINQALRANYSMKKDVDYVVQDDEVIIVDQFTGRLMKGRAYSDGLHQAIEAKEGVTINQETKTLATITFQNLFRMYKKLSGMTGTAKTEEEEFRNIYNMYVIEIPTNKPVIRVDAPDLVYATKEAKYKAIINFVKERYEKGQPVLIGTIAIETSELISSLLKQAKIPHEVLNAKNHAREAEIISKIGLGKSVTIATNMAGRGTDIKLSDEIRNLGGLCVVGTERHESRRIDNQLRGRSGRQGDPGYTQFFVSMKDDLMVRFGSDRIGEMMKNMGLGDQAIQSKTFTRSIGTAQKRVEGNNFDIRKQLLQYDDVMNNQREIIYEKRNTILDSDSIHEMVLSSFRHHVEDLVNSHLAPEGMLTDNDLNEIVDFANENLLKKDIKKSSISGITTEEVIDKIAQQVIAEYEEKIKEIPEEITDEFEKVITLQVVDNYWMEHINTMSHLREGIHLRGYAQEDPLRAYTMEGFDLFDSMLQKIDKDISIFLLKAEVRHNVERKTVSKKQITNESDEGVKKTPKKSKKIGRNDPCPCGSGKKYKQCCGK